MIEPIRPSDVKKIIPDFVIEAVNQLIKEKWDGYKAVILQDEIMDVISSDDPDNDKPSRREVFDKGWLDFETLYREKGWNVEYDKPGYNEFYNAKFIFKSKKHKFRVGDEIKTSNEEPLTITKIDDKGYWSEDLFICGFDDAAKWELVGQKPDNIEPTDYSSIDPHFGKPIDKIEQKSVWSEEDEKMLVNLIDYFKIDDALQYTEKQVIEWLKSLKERICK